MESYVCICMCFKRASQTYLGRQVALFPVEAFDFRFVLFAFAFYVLDEDDCVFLKFLLGCE
jgi:hypothetical protein